ncbi:hypothetical protein ACWEPC_37910 [Nonomuraea sp. NPDC004297]
MSISRSTAALSEAFQAGTLIGSYAPSWLSSLITRSGGDPAGPGPAGSALDRAAGVPMSSATACGSGAAAGPWTTGGTVRSEDVWEAVDVR